MNKCRIFPFKLIFLISNEITHIILFEHLRFRCAKYVQVIFFCFFNEITLIPVRIDFFYPKRITHYIVFMHDSRIIQDFLLLGPQGRLYIEEMRPPYIQPPQWA